MRSALDHAPFHPLISDIAWLLTGKISQINREIAGDLNLLTTYKPLTFREALFFLLTADRIPGYTAPVEPSNERKINGAYIENPPRIQADGEAPEEMADILHYLADVHRFGQSTKEGTTKHAKETIRQLTAAIDVNEDWMLKKQEFTSLTVHDTLSEVGYRRDKGSAASQAGENDEFFDAVKRELLNSRQDLSYVDEKGNEVKLLEFRLVSEQSHTTVLKSIVNVVDVAVRQGPLVPYESIAQQLRIRTPGISRPQVQSFLEVALKWSRSSLDPVSVAAVAEQLVAAGAKTDAVRNSSFHCSGCRSASCCPIRPAATRTMMSPHWRPRPSIRPNGVAALPQTAPSMSIVGGVRTACRQLHRPCEICPLTTVRAVAVASD